jgi:hypothetical protein
LPPRPGPPPLAWERARARTVTSSNEDHTSHRCSGPGGRRRSDRSRSPPPRPSSQLATRPTRTVPLLTAVRLSEGPSTSRRLVLGEPDDLQVVGHHKNALFSPGRVVAYLVVRARARVLFLFRTSPRPAVASTIVGVSHAVDILVVASTARAVRKASAALRLLARVRGLDVDALSDAFWLRLADSVVARRASRLSARVMDLLRSEHTPPTRSTPRHTPTRRSAFSPRTRQGEHEPAPTRDEGARHSA